MLFGAFSVEGDKVWRAGAWSACLREMALSLGERAGAGPSIPRQITGPWTKMLEELPIGSENAL